MQYPRAHRFLAWAGPSVVVLVGSFIGLIAALAPTYPGVKKWGEDWFNILEPIVAARWFLLPCIILVLGYFAALIWTSQPESERNRIRKASLKRKEEFVLDVISPQRDPDGAEANRKDELAANRARMRQSSNDWIPFHEALRYLVYQSQWATNQPAAKDDKEFDKIVAPEVRERLARGEIAARGKRCQPNEAPNRATEPIPHDFWVNAFFLPHGEIALASDERGYVATVDGDGPAYCAVIVRKSEVERAWPPRIGRWPTPLSRCVEDVRARIAAEKAPSEDDLSDEWEWLVAKQEGRTKVERDKPLGEALAYTGLGRWGGRFSDAAAQGIGAADVPLKKFQQLAYDGRLHVWGKSGQHRDLYEEIPREHWRNNRVDWFDLLRGEPRTEPRGQTSESPYYDLMVSRAEFEELLPYVAAPKPMPEAAPAAAIQDNPEPITVDVPHEEQQRLGRTFVRKNVTPRSLMEIYEGRTSIEADPLAKSQLGKWMRLWAKVLKTQGSGERILVSVSTADELPPLGIIMMYFDGQHDHLSMLRPEDRILVEGEITDIHSFTVIFENCELLSVGDEAIS